MIRLEMKNSNMILTEKQRNYEHYHQAKLLKAKKYYLPIKVEL